MVLRSLEICAGAGGQALGLEMAGFAHSALVEIDQTACATLRHNRPHWDVRQGDVKDLSGAPFTGIELLAGGVPCPPFSKAGQQRGKDDERDLFPEALRLVKEAKPQAVMLENVKGFLDARFDTYRTSLVEALNRLGYEVQIKLLNACDFGVPQLRPSVVLVAMPTELMRHFYWPQPTGAATHVGDALLDLMVERGWHHGESWRQLANRVAPTLVGGSKKHGGPDLGPTRAKREWEKLGVDGMGIADFPPAADFQGLPRLTPRMAARIQGFPDDWHFVGKKTASYRQIGNAFPPPVASAVGSQIAACFEAVKMTYKKRA